MKKIISVFFCLIIFSNPGLAENYYFKNCKMGENFIGNFLIDIEKNNIYRIFKNTNSDSVLEKKDKIKFITKNEIVSEVIQSRAGSEHYFQYYLDAVADSVSIQKYKKDSVIKLLTPDGLKEISICEDVKSDWHKSKTKKQIVEEKKQKEFENEKSEERLKAKKKKEAELQKQLQKKKIKQMNQYRISIDGKFFQAAKPEQKLKSEKELEKAFNEKAVEICAAKGSFDILEKMTLVVEVGETSAFPKKGLTAGIRLGIRGIVECK